MGTQWPKEHDTSYPGTKSLAEGSRHENNECHNVFKVDEQWREGIFDSTWRLRNDFKGKVWGNRNQTFWSAFFFSIFEINIEKNLLEFLL